MARTDDKRGNWMIAVEVSVLAIFAAIIIVVAALPGGQGSSDPASAVAAESGAMESEATEGGDEMGDVSHVADAGTTGLTESEGTGEGTGGGEQRFDPEVDNYVPNEVLVMVDDPAVLDSLTPGTQLGDAQVHSVEVISNDSDGGSVVKLTLDGNGPVDSSIDALNAMEGVSAQKNFIYHLM